MQQDTGMGLLTPKIMIVVVDLLKWKIDKIDDSLKAMMARKQ